MDIIITMKDGLQQDVAIYHSSANAELYYIQQAKNYGVPVEEEDEDGLGDDMARSRFINAVNEHLSMTGKEIIWLDVEPTDAPDTSDNDGYNILQIKFDEETNQAISGEYNGGAIEGMHYHLEEEKESRRLPDHIQKTIDFLNSL